ncbi:MAG: diguanylate cyclase, partial [Campylobacterota bacterium]|nr:diguanylate cyclase [Campylobacterota bacterium]
NKSRAMELAERIRNSIESIKLEEINNQPISASFGVSLFNKESPQLDLIGQSDIALYQAKKSGRNKTVLYSG